MLIKREAFNLLVVVVALVASTALLTEADSEAWRLAGSVLLIYLLFVGIQALVWSRRRSSRDR